MVANENCPFAEIAANVVLKKMGIINCEQCTFCDEKDFIEHFLWECYFTRRFWWILENLISTSCETACNIKITENLVLFGLDSTVITDNIFDLIILLAKQYLYRCKFEQSVPLVSVFRKQLKLNYKLEEYNSKITFQENAFNARWHCCKTFAGRLMIYSNWLIVIAWMLRCCCFSLAQLLTL